MQAAAAQGSTCWETSKVKSWRQLVAERASLTASLIPSRRFLALEPYIVWKTDADELRLPWKLAILRDLAPELREHARVLGDTLLQDLFEARANTPDTLVHCLKV